MLGDIKSTKVLRNGSLLVICKDSAQQGKAISVNKIEGKRCSWFESKMYVQGVITVMPKGITEQQVTENVMGAKVIELKQLRTTRNG